MHAVTARRRPQKAFYMVGIARGLDARGDESFLAILVAQAVVPVPQVTTRRRDSLYYLAVI